jgi:flagellar basal body-associated protein FliL
VPACLVLLIFGLGHSLVQNDYSGIYFEEIIEEAVEADENEDLEILEELPDEVMGDGNLILADKYNYLKIENIFQGHLLDTGQLFSLEIAIATYQTNVTADFFIKAIAEIESDLVSKVTTLLLDTMGAELTTVAGRSSITDKVKDCLNDYLIEEGYNPDIHYVYIINYNIV